MSATIRIRHAQLRGAMTARQAREIAILQQGRRLVHASVGSRQRAALAGITEYWTTRVLPPRLAGRDLHDVLGLGISALGNSIIPREEIVVW